MAKKKLDGYDGDSANGADFDEEPNFDDPEGFVDDVTDEGKFFDKSWPHKKWTRWQLKLIESFADFH